jgi:mono/diheme cytochrome c family protein
MIFARMSRPIRVLLITSASAVIAALASACGTERIAVANSDPAHSGAVLFAQRCSGCHTLSYAATHGSASNIRSAEQTNGPNFNVRCERPVARVLYAIENGGFSGLIMPQNVVVGNDAIAVAQFVSKYAGRQEPNTVGVVPCASKQVGSIPPPASATAATTTTTSTTATGARGARRPSTKGSHPQAQQGAAGRPTAQRPNAGS